MFDILKNKITAKSVAVAFAVVSGSAFADDATSTAISSAITSGQTNVSAVTAGVIAVSALCFGVGLVVRWLSK